MTDNSKRTGAAHYEPWRVPTIEKFPKSQAGTFAAVHESEAGTSRTSRDVRLESAKWAKADIDQVAVTAQKAASMERARREGLADLDPSPDAASAIALTGGSMLLTLRGPVPP